MNPSESFGVHYLLVELSDSKLHSDKLLATRFHEDALLKLFRCSDFDDFVKEECLHWRLSNGVSFLRGGKLFNEESS